MPMLEISGIYKAYRRQEILKGVTLTVKPGECVGIVGYNGCGKTTLLSILAGARKADRGSIRYNGREAVGYPRVFAEEAAYVPQENPLMEDLTVRDNLLLWYRGGKAAMRQDLETGAGAMLGVDEMLKCTAGKLSGGMKKRVSIACALSNHAPVLILDDSTSAVDTATDARIRRAFAEEIPDTTKLIIAQRISSIQSADRIIVMDEGKSADLELMRN